MAEKVKRRKCAMRGCRKGAMVETGFCPAHSLPTDQPQAPVSEPAVAEEPDPLDKIVKMTELECLRLGKVDAEREAALSDIQKLEQDLKLSEYRHRDATAKLQSEYDEYVGRKLEEKKGKISIFEAKHAQYRALVTSIAKNVGLDPECMTYDVETGVLRDLRPPDREGGTPPQ